MSLVISSRWGCAATTGIDVTPSSAEDGGAALRAVAAAIDLIDRIDLFEMDPWTELVLDGTRRTVVFDPVVSVVSVGSATPAASAASAAAGVDPGVFCDVLVVSVGPWP